MLRRIAMILVLSPFFPLQIRMAGRESSLEDGSSPCCGRKVKSTCCLLPRKTSASTKPPVSQNKKQCRFELTLEDRSLPRVGSNGWVTIPRKLILYC